MATPDTSSNRRHGHTRSHPRGRRTVAAIALTAFALSGCLAAEAETPALGAEPIPPDHLVPFPPDRPYPECSDKDGPDQQAPDQEAPDQQARDDRSEEPLLPDHLMQ